MSTKKIIFLFALIVACCGCSSSSQDEILIHKEHSMMKSFYVEDEIVHIICTIILENKTDADITVNISARSQEDAQNGLIADPVMKGINSETQDEYFVVKAGQCSEYTVDFQGAFGGNNQKTDRLIPDVLELTKVE